MSVWKKILLFLLQESLKFKMLVYLLEHQQVSIIRLATAFNISESSVFRKIKELNQLLEEFGLQIKNGQLYGEELQIRYFYYELFQYIPEDQRPFFAKYTRKKTIHSRIGPRIRNDVYGISRSTDCLLARDHEKDY